MAKRAAQLRSRPMTRRPPRLEAGSADDEHRGFPRVEKSVQFTLAIGERNARTFSATLSSRNLSVSGAFLKSTFFLPVGTELRVSFEVDADEEPVQARAAIVREQRSESADSERNTGFGIRFLEFYEQTEVALAKLFLGRQLRAFAQGYLQSKRARARASELDRVVDALAAWELLNITTASDPWKPSAGKKGSG